MKHQVMVIVCTVLVAGLLADFGGQPDTRRLRPQRDLGPSSSDFVKHAMEIKKSGILVTKERPFTELSQLEMG